MHIDFRAKNAVQKVRRQGGSGVHLFEYCKSVDIWPGKVEWTRWVIKISTFWYQKHAIILKNDRMAIKTNASKRVRELGKVNLKSSYRYRALG